jgi:hypothetical protein
MAGLSMSASAAKWPLVGRARRSRTSVCSSDAIVAGWCWPEQPAAANYTFTTVAGTLTVTKAPVVVTPNPASGPYGTIPAVTPSYSGFKNNETAAVLTTPATCQANTTTTTVPGTHQNKSTCSGAR